MSKLDGKIALIIGGTSGIGEATAKRFQSEGATVIATGNNPKTLAAARQAMPRIEILASDAVDTKATKTLMDGVKSRHGRIDVLFVNAGIAKFAPNTMVDEAFYDAQFDVNVRGVFFAIKHAAPHMSDGGSIILTASTASSQGREGMTVYGASKAAVRSFGRSFAAELASRRIRVNTISPGPIDTPIFGKTGLSSQQTQELVQSLVARIPLQRIGKPDDVAAAALFLASDDSAFITGVELFVDGGIVNLG